MFRADSKLMKMLTKIANMLIVSVLWCICCIPVITIIPACAALFHTTVEIIQGNGMGVVRDFLLTFREEIAKGIFFTLGSIIVVFLLSVCVYFGWRNYDKVLGMFYLMLGIVLLLFTILVLLHLPVVFSEYSGKPGVVVRLTVYMLSTRLIQALFELVLLAVLVFMTINLPVLIFLIPGLFMDIVSKGMKKGLSRVAMVLEEAA